MSKVERMPKVSLLDFISQKLTEADNGLGDRSTYVGASDIGQCLRKSYLNKFQKPDYDLKQMLIFERGHLGEGLVKKVLLAGELKFEEQVELIGFDGFEFIKGHVDFLCESRDEVVIIEVKTVDLMPEQPYSSWVYQTQLQMWLASNRYPGKHIRAKIIAWDMNRGGLKEWDQTPSEELAIVARDRASGLWVAMQNSAEPAGECDHLCAHCPFSGSCHSLRTGAIEVPADVADAAKKLRTIQRAKKDEKKLREIVVDFFKAAGIKKGAQGEMTITVVESSGKETVDVERLRAEMPDVYERYKSKGDSYSYVKVA